MGGGRFEESGAFLDDGERLSGERSGLRAYWA